MSPTGIVENSVVDYSARADYKRKKMTQKEFYEVLGAIKGWYLDYGGLIRRRGRITRYQCPLTAVYYKLTRKKVDLPRHREIAKNLLLNPTFASNIADAADGKENKLRGRLLKACNLKERI